MFVLRLWQVFITLCDTTVDFLWPWGLPALHDLWSQAWGLGLTAIYIIYIYIFVIKLKCSISILNLFCFMNCGSISFNMLHVHCVCVSKNVLLFLFGNMMTLNAFPMRCIRQWPWFHSRERGENRFLIYIFIHFRIKYLHQFHSIRSDIKSDSIGYLSGKDVKMFPVPLLIRWFE